MLLSWSTASGEYVGGGRVGGACMAHDLPCGHFLIIPLEACYVLLLNPRVISHCRVSY